MNLLLKYEMSKIKDKNFNSVLNVKAQQTTFEHLINNMSKALARKKTEMIFDSINRNMTGR